MPPPDAKTGSQLKSRLTGAAAIAVSATCLYLFARGTDWPEVWKAIAGARVPWLLASLVACWTSVVLRAVRWRVMLADVRKIRLARLYNIQMIGIVASGVLPARVGELARGLLLARLGSIPLFGAFASVVGERLLDLVAVGGLLVLSIAVFDFPAGRTVDLPWLSEPLPADAILAQAGAGLGVIFAGLVITVAVVLLVPRLDALVHALLGRFSRPLADAATRAIAAFRQGLGFLRRPLAAGQALLWTLVIWTFIALANYCVFPAFGLATGLAGTLLLTAGLAVSVALPQAPSSLGVFQVAVTLILVTCLDVPEAEAKAFAIVLWLIQLFALIALGFISLAVEGVALGDLRRARSAE